MTGPNGTLGMISNAVNNSYFQIDSEFVIVPGLAIFLTVRPSTCSETGCATRSIREAAGRSMPILSG
jgi:hypothetical protein